MNIEEKLKTQIVEKCDQSIEILNWLKESLYQESNLTEKVRMVFYEYMLNLRNKQLKKFIAIAKGD